MSKREKEYWKWTEYSWRDVNIDWKDAKFITVGVDVGSVSSQAVIMVDGQLLAYSNIRTGSSSPDSAYKAVDLALKGTGIPKDRINYCVGTGYGRINVPMANKTITEIACHARGANFLYGPNVRTVLDIGGQDIKVIRCDEKGKVINFLMNDKCAAGTGRGIEVIADLLKVPITEVGDLSFRCQEGEPEPVSSTCVVYAKSEVIALLRKGWSVECVLAAYCKAMAIRIYSLLKRIDVCPGLAITGGISKNRGIVDRLKDLVGLEPMKTRWDAQIAGAVGAALFGYTICVKK